MVYEFDKNEDDESLNKEKKDDDKLSTINK